MARLFDDSASEHGEVTAVPAVNAPLSMACWFYSDDAGAQQTLMSVAHSVTANHYQALIADGTLANDPIYASSRAGGSARSAITAVGYSVNTWHHALGVFAASNSRSTYLDGGNKATDTNSVTPTATRTSIGRLGRSTPGLYMSGRIAEAAIWNVALSDDDALALAAGFCPLMVRPDALVAYWPLIGVNSPETDEVAPANNLTLSGTAQADHPPIIYPSGIIDVVKASGGAPPAVNRRRRVIMTRAAL